ncbi:N-formylglutamate amidohydrolase [Hypericibacter adhaerens]|uniref:N-formylglutamate amidohydrolase n=1 Tax=Hypericibacter adhaerens TaxID=2602016 RepID=A0A5J6N3Y2_9PROT|nr:N-formylglutamate amidohydrolase [Hypericibacter adhaerens]QEX24114.1 N-formylglutamate amidohydrolase [Hypericibacter adhaerens]
MKSTPASAKPAAPLSAGRPAGSGAAFEILAPAAQTVPLVFSSPHSGRDYAPELLAQSRLDPLTLRRSEDSYVDELFAAAPEHGAPLLRALFPRVFVDPNREALELDPAMFSDALPAEANATSPRVAAGLGSIARVVASGEEIYGRKLTRAEAEARLDRYWRPYHTALQELLAGTRRRFGHVLLIDCHSMPSVGGPMERDAGDRRLDFVLGDCHGRSCAPALTDRVEAILKADGFRVERNAPYAGGYVTQHYGRPAEGLHTLQIEVNRALYMDEATYERRPGFAALQRAIGRLIGELARIERTAFAA